ASKPTIFSSMNENSSTGDLYGIGWSPWGHCSDLASGSSAYKAVFENGLDRPAQQPKRDVTEFHEHFLTNDLV
ncbi:MAG: hypothetical protein ABJ310_10320, partial [Roseobacter sp.]